MIETLNKAMQAQKQLIQGIGHELTVEEVAKKVKMSVKGVQTVMKMAQRPISSPR
jgi:DNA-directed RNA polymerase sigma subunit (sigma70/sigma32)